MFKFPFQSKICFSCSSFSWMFELHCARMLHQQNLTLEGCFHIHLLKVESFPVLKENLSLRHITTIMICDITTSLKPVWSSMQDKSKVDFSVK